MLNPLGLSGEPQNLRLQSLDAHTQPLYGRLQAAYGRTKVANGDFSKLPEHMQHAAQTIAARCVGNHSTLRMELHRTAENAPALWSGKTTMMKGFGKERSGYLPSPNKPRTNLMTAGYFREEFLGEARSDIAFIWLR